VAVDPGPPPPDVKPWGHGERTHVDEPLAGHELGGVVVAPSAAYAVGDRVLVALSGTYPCNDLHRGSTHWEVQALEGERWTRVADDGDWSTRLHWVRVDGTASRITLTWDADRAGRFRFRYHGAQRRADGSVSPLTATTREFVVR
jgi:neutral ceramidase